MARTYNSGWREWMGNRTTITTNFTVEGLQEQIQQLDKLLASNPAMEERMRKVIRKVMAKADRMMTNELHSDLTNDPRNAYKAVKHTVYRRILGGNVNILQKRRRGAATKYEPTRTLKSGQRGGNRRLRSERTHRMDSYDAGDRGFILRFLNSGTSARKIKFQEDSHRASVRRGLQGGSKYGKTTNTGLRGRIQPRNIFASKLVALGDYIDTELEREFQELIQQAAREGD